MKWVLTQWMLLMKGLSREKAGSFPTVSVPTSWLLKPPREHLALRFFLYMVVSFGDSAHLSHLSGPREVQNLDTTLSCRDEPRAKIFPALLITTGECLLALFISKPETLCFLLQRCILGSKSIFFFFSFLINCREQIRWVRLFAGWRGWISWLRSGKERSCSTPAWNLHPRR